MKFRCTVVSIMACLCLAACAPAARPTGPSESARPSEPTVAPSRTLVVASRNEPPTLAAKPLRFVAAPRGINVPLFNGTLDYLDNRGNGQPYLAEALPQLNT